MKTIRFRWIEIGEQFNQIRYKNYKNSLLKLDLSLFKPFLVDFQKQDERILRKIFF